MGPLIGLLLLLLAGAAQSGWAPSLAGLQGPAAAAGLATLGFQALARGFVKPGANWPRTSGEALRLRLRWSDYPKALIAWIGSFRRTYAIEPGLYFTGEAYDPDSPLLVTANYQLTVFLLLRNLRPLNVRVLVVDTDGINVWCAAGKGTFGNRAIEREIERYDRMLLTRETWLTMILPKVGMSGVDLRALRSLHIRPLVGPVYAKDLRAYLSRPKLDDCVDDRVHFGLRMRCFTWLPGLVQFLGYSILVLFGLAILDRLWALGVPLELLGITAVVATAYPLLFPWLPGRAFATKGLALGAALSIGVLGLGQLGHAEPTRSLAGVFFVFATSIFFALSYTGNSAVSAQSKVRKEIARFLVPSAILYLLAFATFVVSGVRS